MSSDSLKTDRHVNACLLLVVAGVALIYLINSLLPSIIMEYQQWVERRFVPALKPVGYDFRYGMYKPAQMLSQWVSPYSEPNWYPPFVALVSLPFVLFSEDAAYMLQVGLLFVCNIASLLIALLIVQKAVTGASAFTADKTALVLFAALSLFTVNSYGFMFSVERGNCDIYPLFFSLLFLWLLLTRPKSIWLPTLALSGAIHLKVYPALFVVLLIWRHRWKALLPLCVVNGALLLCLGPSDALNFLTSLKSPLAQPYLWIGNHSALAFDKMILEPLGFATAYSKVLCSAIPAVVWIAGTVIIIRRGLSDRALVLLFILSVPVMNLLPGTSHDYKLVILSAPLAMLLFLVIHDYARKSLLTALAVITTLLLLAGFLGRSYQVTETLWLQNKYPFILVFQSLVLLMVIFMKRLQGERVRS